MPGSVGAAGYQVRGARRAQEAADGITIAAKEKVLQDRLAEATSKLAGVQGAVGEGSQSFAATAGDLKKQFKEFKAGLNGDVETGWKHLFKKMVGKEATEETAKKALWQIYKTSNLIFAREADDVQKLRTAVQVLTRDYLPTLASEQVDLARRYEECKSDVKAIVEELKPIIAEKEAAQASDDMAKMTELQAKELALKNELRDALMDADFYKNSVLLAQGTIDNYTKFSLVVDELIAQASHEMVAAKQVLEQMAAGIEMIGGAWDVQKGLEDLMKAVEFGTKTMADLEKAVALRVAGNDQMIQAHNQSVAAMRADANQVLDQVLEVLQLKQDIKVEEMLKERVSLSTEATQYEAMIPTLGRSGDVKDVFQSSSKIARDMMGSSQGMVDKFQDKSDSLAEWANKQLYG